MSSILKKADLIQSRPQKECQKSNGKKFKNEQDIASAEVHTPNRSTHKIVNCNYLAHNMEQEEVVKYRKQYIESSVLSKKLAKKLLKLIGGSNELFIVLPNLRKLKLFENHYL